MAKLTHTVEMKCWDTDHYNDWVDITPDVVGTVHCTSGMTGTRLEDRVANVGVCTFDLNNSASNSAGLAGRYSPNHANWSSATDKIDEGTIIRVRFNFEEVTRAKWYGMITGISPEPGTKLTQRTNITANDWMYQAATEKLKLKEYTTNKGLCSAMPLVIADMQFLPLATQFEYEMSTFPAIFDNIDYKTTAMEEFQKLAASELGYVFVKHNIANDELLFSKGRTDRVPLAPLSQYSLPTSACFEILDEDGTAILDEDGTNLLCDDAADIVFSDDQMELGYAYKPIYNYVTVTAHPRKVDATAKVLFNLENPILVKTGETITGYRVTYRDPDGKATSVCGKDMVTPVATTDYLFNTAADGTGTNITADLVIVSTLGVSDSEFSFTNNNASDGYIFFFQLRGKGIYTYDAVSAFDQDTTSITQYGKREFTFDMPYQADPSYMYVVAGRIIFNYKTPRQKAASISFIPGTDDEVQRFLCMDCDGNIHVEETQTAINSDHYIQGWSFDIIGYNDVTGDIVNVTAYLFQKELTAYSIDEGF